MARSTHSRSRCNSCSSNSSSCNRRLQNWSPRKRIRQRWRRSGGFAAGTAVITPDAPIAPAKWSPAQSLTVTKAGPAYLNLSLVGDTVFGWSTTPDVETIEGAHHDPSQRGFTLQGAELTLDGAVDPYFKALVTVPLVLEPGGETVVELEEAWVQTTSLPWNLQVKAGQLFRQLRPAEPAARAHVGIRRSAAW